MRSGVQNLLIGLALAASLARPALSQRISGVVRDTAAGEPVSGATISALDSARHTVARTISNASGRYSLAVPPSARLLRVQRIGFQPRELALPAAREAVATVDVAMTHIATQLSAVRVSDESVCPTSAADNGVQGTGALAVWAQVRDALLAAQVAREANPANVEIFRYDRDLGANGVDVTREQAVRETGPSTQPFVPLLPPPSFAERGYMLEDNAAGRQFGAPDIDVMLDPSFASTHCFHTVRSDAPEHAGEIGLAFAPAPGRDSLVDVEGTIWLDVAPPALRSMEFFFTGLERAARDAHAGGAMHFATMPNGVVFVDAWSLRLPALALIRSQFDAAETVQMQHAPEWQRRLARHDVRVASLHEAGGIVLDAVWPDGPRWRAPVASIAGRVTERGTRLPLAGVLVQLTQANDTVVTDSAGHFAITPALPGHYTLRATDTALAAAADPRHVERDVAVVAAPAITTIDVEMPKRPTLADVQTTTLRGVVVRAADKAPVAGADVWLPAVDRHATTDSNGVFVMAKLPRGLELVQVRHVGYAPMRDTATLAGVAVVKVYALMPQTAMLDTVRTKSSQVKYLSPALQGFEERRLSHAGGYFISDSALRANDNSPLSDVLSSRVAGAAMENGLTPGTRAFASTRKMCQGSAFAACKRPDCYVAVYIDGSAYWYPTLMKARPPVPPPNLDQFLTDQFGGVEFYPGGASSPAGMEGNDEGCGSLWLWTREK